MPLGTTNFDNQEARHDTVFTRLAKLIAENWRHLETTGVNVVAVIWLRNPKHFGSIFFLKACGYVYLACFLFFGKFGLDGTRFSGVFFESSARKWDSISSRRRNGFLLPADLPLAFRSLLAALLSSFPAIAIIIFFSPESLFLRVLSSILRKNSDSDSRAVHSLIPK